MLFYCCDGVYYVMLLGCCWFGIRLDWYFRRCVGSLVVYVLVDSVVFDYFNAVSFYYFSLFVYIWVLLLCDFLVILI